MHSVDGADVVEDGAALSCDVASNDVFLGRRELLVADGGGGLSARHRAARLRVLVTGGAVVRGAGVERRDADQARLRLRAGDEGVPAPSLPPDRRREGRPRLDRRETGPWRRTCEA